MDSESFQQYSQQSVNNGTPSSQFPIDSQLFSQTNMDQSNSFVHPEHFHSQFTSLNLQYHRTLPLNPMNARFSSQPQQLDPRLSFQGLLNAQTEVSTPNASKGHKKRTQPNKEPEIIQSTSLRWTEDEDVALTKAHLYVSGDADVGIGQKSSALWRRILQVWREKMREKTGGYNETRDSNALECRWSRIQRAVNTFHAFYEQLERNPKSGTTLEDMDERMRYGGKMCG